MKFFVNFLSAFRIASAFALIPLLMFSLYNPVLFWWSFGVFVLAAMSDWFDGFLARKYNVCTKLGGVMDHIGDKLLVANTLIMLTVLTPLWFIIVPIIIMIARELYISGLREFLGTQKIEMPVPKARFSMGKIKTTLQMISICAFLLLFALSTLVSDINAEGTIMRIINILTYIGIWGIWLALFASVWSATQYTFTFVQKLKQIKK